MYSGDRVVAAPKLRTSLPQTVEALKGHNLSQFLELPSFWAIAPLIDSHTPAHTLGGLP